MTRNEIAKGVADKLFATEDSVDMAMVRASQLLETMITARQTLRVSATTGEVDQARVAEAISALSEARRAVMAAHGALASVQQKMGIVDTAVGPLEKPGQGVQGLRIAV